MISLTNLYMKGFKSFADATSVDFNQGLTCVVGPNGCGKSNICDAVRWVLGEQRTKALRGDPKTGVIFDGTQLRSESNSCEVAISFDNSAGYLKTDMKDVVISREVFRSGDVRYRLNGKKARYKDIQAIIRDTGIGRDGYSIIAQGKVNEIIMSKPSERRRIFEEAAGCAQFRADKKDAENKLFATDANISLCQNSLTLIKNNLDILEQEAAVLQKYNEVAKDLKSAEVNKFIYFYNNADAMKAEFDVKITQLSERISGKEQLLAEASMHYSNYLDKSNTLPQEIIKLNDQINDISLKNQDFNHRVDSFKTELRAAEAKLKNAKKTIDDNTEIVKNKQKLISECKAKQITLSKRLEELQAEYDEVARSHSELTDQLLSSEQLLDNKNQDTVALLNKISDTRAHQAELTAELKAEKEKREELQHTIDENQTFLVESETQRQQLNKKLQELESSIKTIREQSRMMGISCNNAKGELKECNQEILATQTKLTQLELAENTYNVYEQFTPVVQRLMDDALRNEALRDNYEGLVADLISVKDKRYALAIETALGGALQNIVVQSEENGQKLIEHIKRKNYEGRISIIPLLSTRGYVMDEESRRLLSTQMGFVGFATQLVSYDPKYKNLIDHLLGGVTVFDNMTNTTALVKRYRNRFKLVTLEGEYYNNNGHMSGGRSENKRQLLQGREEQQRVAQQIKACREKLKELKETQQDLINDIESYEGELINFAEKQKGKEKEQTYNEAELRSLTVSIQNANNILTASTATLSTCTARIDVISEDLSALDRVDTILQSNKAAAGTETGDVRQQRTGISEKLEKLRLRKEQLAVDKKECDNAIAINNMELQRAEQDERDFTAAIKTAESDIVTSESDVFRLNAEIEKVRFEVIAGDEADALRRQVSEKQSELDVVYSKINMYDEQKKELFVEIGTLKESQGKLQGKKENVDISLQDIKDRVFADYGLTFETAQEYYDETYDNDTVKERIDSLKRKLAAFKNVNLNADNAYQLSKAEFEEKNTQLEDLIVAKNNLTDTISTLSQNIEVRFNDAFSKISVNYEKVFKDLFAGQDASAKLVLTNVKDNGEPLDDPLDAGVEIYAQPPGKTLKSLVALSGGEQALTAIAILFAILRLKPLPFCILDEIEAALDETNVDIFARYLSRYKNNTQFIVITHHKKTMEYADTLYGVTMEEKGVSKPYYVKMDEIDKLLKDDVVQ